MNLNTKLFEVIKRCSFVIPEYQRHYSWKKKNCEQLVHSIVSAYKYNRSCYVGNVFFEKISDYTLNIIDGQQRTLSVYLLYLALMYKAYANKYYYTDEINEIKRKLDEKFAIKTQDQKFFNEFKNLFKEWLDNQSKDFKTISKEHKENNYVRNFLVFVNCIEKHTYTNNSEEKENKIKFEDLCNMLHHIEVIEIVIDKKVVDYENKNGIDLYKLFDCLNSTGEPLTYKDIIHSRIIECQNKVLNENVGDDKSLINKWKEFVASFNQEDLNFKVFDLFLNNFFKNLGYKDTVIESFDFEIVKLLGNQENNAQNLKDAHQKLIERMSYVKKFTNICAIQYGEFKDSDVTDCFYAKDKSKLDSVKIKWFKYYLDGINLSKNNLLDVAQQLYMHYLESDNKVGSTIKFGVDELFECLRYLWWAATRAFMNFYYDIKAKNSKTSFNSSKRIEVRCLDNFQDLDDFKTYFKQCCKDYIPNVVNDGKNITNPEDLSNYLIYTAEHPKDHEIHKYVKGTHYNKEKGQSLIFEYYLHLILFADCKNLEYRLTYQSRNLYKTAKKQDVGSILILQHKADDIHPLNYKLDWNAGLLDSDENNKEVAIKERSQKLLSRVFSIIDVDLEAV